MNENKNTLDLRIVIAILITVVIGPVIIYAGIRLVDYILPSRAAPPRQPEEIATGSAKSMQKPGGLVEVAAGKPTSSSGNWQYSSTYFFSPDAIVDRRIEEIHCDFGTDDGNSYWLLPDHQSGWVQVDLKKRFAIVKLRWLNTHNGECADRATTGYRIALSDRNTFIGEEIVVAEGKMTFSLTPTYEEITLDAPVPARYVRFYIEKYHDWGGGLNELEVYAQDTDK